MAAELSKRMVPVLAGVIVVVFLVGAITAVIRSEQETRDTEPREAIVTIPRPSGFPTAPTTATTATSSGSTSPSGVLSEPGDTTTTITGTATSSPGGSTTAAQPVQTTTTRLSTTTTVALTTTTASPPGLVAGEPGSAGGQSGPQPVTGAASLLGPGLGILAIAHALKKLRG